MALSTKHTTGNEMEKTIEVEFCEEQVTVDIEIYVHNDKPEFSIIRVELYGVDILHVIECLGGLGELSEKIEKKLKEENCDD